MFASLARRLFRNRHKAHRRQLAATNPDVCIHALRAGKLDIAAQCFRDYLSQHPDDASSYNNLGVTLQQLGNQDEALHCYETAIRLSPQNADAWYNAGLIRHIRRDFARAENYYLNALRADPTAAEAHREYSMLRLVQGDFSKQVWSSFRYRRNCEGFKLTASRCPAPTWNGEPLGKKKVLVHGEQALGDEILFASCYPDLIASASHCVIETEPRLESLFRRSFSAATVFGRHHERELQAQYPSIAYQVPCGDLPLYFRSSIDEFPKNPSYLSANVLAVDRWRRVLGALGTGLKIGISWRGGTQWTGKARRSINLEEWRPLFRIPNVHFVNLQYDDCAEELASAREAFGTQIHHWQEAIADYDETAALVTALDLVISVQTSLVHLAGALGQNVWTLVSTAPRWCYMQDGSTMPWYPSVRVFRQSHFANWDSVIEQATDTLKQEALNSKSA